MTNGETLYDGLAARYRENEPHFQSLEAHLQETATLSSVFGESFGFSRLAYLAALLHDVGKATADWQAYLADSVAGKSCKKIDHATAGAQMIAECTGNSVSLAATAIQAAVMYHHGSGLPDMISPNGSSEFLERLGKPAAKLSEIRENLGERVSAEISECLASDEWKNDGRKELLDVCKSGCASKKQLLFNMGLHLRALSSCLIDADRTDSAAFESGEKIVCTEKIPDWNTLLLRLENHLGNFQNCGTLGSIRSTVSERCAELGRGGKGIFTCSAFTGAGKTLASLRFALGQAKKHSMKRIVIVAPYTSIIDQNADEIRSILEDEATRGRIVLECHSNVTGEKKRELLDTESDYERYEATWDAPVIITTMVQFLETLFGSGTKKIRRMHRLADSVLVFDEIQTLPIKTTYLFNWALEYLVECCGCSAMLCTATQPCLDTIGDAAYHLHFDGEVVRDVASHFSALKRVRFVDKSNAGRHTVSASEVCGYIEEQMKACGSFLAVVNTKPQAKELFELVKENGFADFVYHLSTNMCPAHRRKSIEEIRRHLEAGERVVCVSTRLIEAGVDVSFGGALRYLAGLDSIIQTAGRCNRNDELTDADGNKICGTVAIFAVQDENIGSLKELEIGQNQMKRVLRNCGRNADSDERELINPDVIERYFTYFYEAVPDSLLKYSVSDKDTTVLDMLSDNENAYAEYKRTHDNAVWTLPYRQSFKTAWENFEVIADATTGIIVPYAGNDVAGRLSALERGEENYGEKLRSLLREAQQYSVNVYPNQLFRLMREKMIYEVIPDSEIYALHEGFYDEAAGLSFELCDSGSLLMF